MPLLLNITPKTRALVYMGETDTNTAKKVAELINNSIDAKVGPIVHVDVIVRSSKDPSQSTLVITDDASGMDQKGLEAAWTIADSAKKGKKGGFGYGMKTGINGLGPYATVTTWTEKSKPLRSTYEAEKYLAEDGKWVMPCEPVKAPAPTPSGTQIIVDFIPMRAEMLVTLLEEGLPAELDQSLKRVLKLTLNGKSVLRRPVELDPATKISFEVKTQNYSVKVNAGLTTKFQKHAGGRAFRKNELIVKQLAGFAPGDEMLLHPTMGYFDAEFHFSDNVPVTHTKNGFKHCDEEFWYLLSLAKHKLKGLLAGARDRYKTVQGAQDFQNAENLTLRANRVIEKTSEKLIQLATQHETTTKTITLRSRTGKGSPIQPGTGKPPITVEYRADNAGAGSLHMRWFWEKDILTIITNLDHPRCKSITSKTVLQDLALQDVIDGMVQYLETIPGNNNSLLIKDQLLREVFNP